MNENPWNVSSKEREIDEQLGEINRKRFELIQEKKLVEFMRKMEFLSPDQLQRLAIRLGEFRF